MMFLNIHICQFAAQFLVNFVVYHIHSTLPNNFNFWVLSEPYENVLCFDVADVLMHTLQ